MTVAIDLELLRRQPQIAPAGWLAAVGRSARRNPVGAAAGLVCILLVVVAILGPRIAPYPADRVGFARLQAPSLTHPFGTDNLFRDIFSRIVVGSRNSLGVGFASVAIAMAIGVVLGVTSGYLGGWWDLLTSRMIEVLLAYPAIVFVIFFLSVFRPSFTSVCLAIGLVLTPGTTRVVRGATIAVRHQPYLDAALVLGRGPLGIMYHHVLPNVMAPIIVVASIQIGIAILAEATISFLGLSISSAANPSWGRMLQETRPVWQAAWWTAVVPGAAISAAVLCFNLFGDALRDALDPRLRGTR
ncbi:MAG TPA: ABC transporter permease [Dehalococcoidia bacterium]|nr:ABC transporter permease [Dehalococcoidia bacterium]